MADRKKYLERQIRRFYNTFADEDILSLYGFIENDLLEELQKHFDIRVIETIEKSGGDIEYVCETTRKKLHHGTCNNYNNRK